MWKQEILGDKLEQKCNKRWMNRKAVQEDFFFEDSSSLATQSRPLLEWESHDISQAMRFNLDPIAREKCFSKLCDIKSITEECAARNFVPFNCFAFDDFLDAPKISPSSKIILQIKISRALIKSTLIENYKRRLIA